MVHFFLGLTFRYVLVNSHLIHPPSNSWLLTLGILQTYPLSESFMIDFLMPYIHRLIDQPPLNHNRQKLISCHCTSGSFQEKSSGPFLVWYFIPGPISCPGTLTHCLLDFWKIVFFKKRTEPPGKKTGSTEEGSTLLLRILLTVDPLFQMGHLNSPEVISTGLYMRRMDILHPLRHLFEGLTTWRLHQGTAGEVQNEIAALPGRGAPLQPGGDGVGSSWANHDHPKSKGTRQQTKEYKLIYKLVPSNPGRCSTLTIIIIITNTNTMVSSSSSSPSPSPSPWSRHHHHHGRVIIIIITITITNTMVSSSSSSPSPSPSPSPWSRRHHHHHHYQYHGFVIIIIIITRVNSCGMGKIPSTFMSYIQKGSPPPMTQMLNGEITSTYLHKGSKIHHPLRQIC